MALSSLCLSALQLRAGRWGVLGGVLGAGASSHLGVRGCGGSLYWVVGGGRGDAARQCRESSSSEAGAGASVRWAVPVADPARRCNIRAAARGV